MRMPGVYEGSSSLYQIDAMTRAAAQLEEQQQQLASTRSKLKQRGPVLREWQSSRGSV